MTRQSGAVSLFVVMFTAMLVTIVTVGFTQLMITNQQQTVENDLSQSAYDSALAGVEDAKRLLIRLAECQRDDNSACSDTLRNIIDRQECSTISDAGVAARGGADDQVVGDADLAQAYTCVKITTETVDVSDSLDTNESAVVPLRTRNAAGFDRVKVTWFVQADAANDDGTMPISATMPEFSSAEAPNALPPASQWQRTMPPILRLQYINANATVSELTDRSGTVFAYPSELGAASLRVSDDNRRSGTIAPQEAQCQTNFATSSSAGVCSVVLRLPSTVASSRTAYLELQPQYNRSHVTIELQSGARTVSFDGTQPIVDSTGRANELFRRVKARVKITSGQSLPYPQATIGVSKNLCKTLFVTSDADDYDAGICDPTQSE